MKVKGRYGDHLGLSQLNLMLVAILKLHLLFTVVLLRSQIILGVVKYSTNLQSMSRWKRSIARLVKRPFIQRLMILVIHCIVPKKRIGVALVVFDKNGRVLLLKHVFHPQTPWGLPGGWLGRNESPQACALRELREETGLSALIGPPIQTTYGNNGPSHIGIIYLGWLDGGTMRLSNEILEAEWVHLDNLPQNLFLTTKEAIEKGHVLNQMLKNNQTI